MIRIVRTPGALCDLEGLTLTSALDLAVTQEMVDRFVAVSGDRQWIHTDTRRAARELANGATIVPGGLLVALLPRLVQHAYRVERFSKAVTAEYRQVRFRHPLPTGSSIRATVAIRSAVKSSAFVTVKSACRVTQAQTGACILTAGMTDVYFD